MPRRRGGGKGVKRGEDGPTASDPTRVGRGRESRMSCCSNTVKKGRWDFGWERWSTKGEEQNNGPKGETLRVNGGEDTAAALARGLAGQVWR